VTSNTTPGPGSQNAGAYFSHATERPRSAARAREDYAAIVIGKKCGNGNKIGVSRNLLRCSRHNQQQNLQCPKADLSHSCEMQSPIFGLLAAMIDVKPTRTGHCTH